MLKNNIVLNKIIYVSWVIKELKINKNYKENSKCVVSKSNIN